MNFMIKISTLIFERRAKKIKRDLYNALKIENENQKLVGNSCPGRTSTLLNYVKLDKLLCHILLNNRLFKKRLTFTWPSPTCYR